VAGKLGISSDALKILFVGRLAFEKGIFDLLNAFSLLQKRVPNVELLIAGSGSPKIQVQVNQLIANLNVSAKVKFLGNIAYSDMPKIHNLADVFCLPSVPTKSWAEQFGYSMIEAMACEKPVVSTSSGSIPEIVKDRATGILVKPHSPGGLKSAIEELIINAEERVAFGRNGRKWVLQQFEATNVAGQLANIFNKFI